MSVIIPMNPAAPWSTSRRTSASVEICSQYRDLRVARRVEHRFADLGSDFRQVDHGSFPRGELRHLTAAIFGSRGVDRARRVGAIAGVHGRGHDALARAVDLIGLGGDGNRGSRSGRADPVGGGHARWNY